MEEIKLDGKPAKKNPADESNIISQLLFCWFIPYFITGYKRELNEDDIHQHRKSHESYSLGARLQAAWKVQLPKTNSPSLVRALIKVFGLEFGWLSFVVLVNETLRFLQPMLISKLLLLYESTNVDDAKNQISLYTLYLIIVCFVNVILQHWYYLQMTQVGMKMRISCSSLIYRKTLKLSSSVLGTTTIGQIVNLISNDVARFDVAFEQFQQFWLGPIQVSMVIYLTYSSFGITGISGLFVLMGCMPLQMYWGKKVSEFRLNTAICTDQRVRLMNEIITGIQVIKMYTWEKPFAKLIQITRLNEIKFIRLTSMIRGLLMSTSLCNSRISICVAIITYVATGNTITSIYAYTIMSYYTILNMFNMCFPIAISQAAELLSTIRRIETFLILEEKTEKSSIVPPKIVTINKGYIRSSVRVSNQRTGFKFENVSAKWVTTQTESNLENMSLQLHSGDLAAIVGPVGSGKSSLLQVILGELEPFEGSIEVHGSISYASQEPWLFGGTLRQNILFGQPFNKSRYEEVIRVCALSKDLAMLPYGDKTLIGERGVTLSGGQKVRVNLARTAYKEADIYLLDDPLAAVDTHVGKQIFDQCICEFLGNKCVVLVTHQLQYLKDIDNIYVIEDGKVKTSGSYEEVKKSDSVFTKLLQDLEKDVKDETKEAVKELLASNSKDVEAPGLNKEERNQGQVRIEVYKSYFSGAGHIIKFVLIFFGFVCSQTLDSVAEYYVTLWVNIQQWSDQNNVVANQSITIYSNSSDNTVFSIPIDASIEDWLVSFFLSNNTVYVYGSIVLLLLLVSNIRSQAFYYWCVSSSAAMHKQMFASVIRSPMRFFTTNPSGRILNRFSNDIGALDEVLPPILIDTIQIGLLVLSIFVIIGTLSPWILLPSLVLIILFYFMRIVYLETSRDLKRIEAVKRSPLFTHLASTFQGLTTIRAFKAEEMLAVEFNKLQNLHSGANFMFLGASSTFGFWVDFNCVVYIGFVMAILLYIKGETLAGNIGLALTQSMGLTGLLQYGIQQWTELENRMTSVERVQEYIDLPKEVEGQVQEPAESWPEQGEISFNKLSLRYSEDLPYVLQKVSFFIEPKAKIGVVGRTGAGKSSLIQALFRLTYIEGSIYIDGVETTTMSLDKLRSKISIIPQDPVLFSGTLRKNLDPFDEYSDDVLWMALEEVELKPMVADLPDGLDSKMTDGGTNFSIGQRQLVCLARAIVRHNKILILDEATANVDFHTDSLIQETIRRKFMDCTVLTVAHRLQTIMDSDKVLVMDAGEVLEYDIPHKLLENENGIFYSLVMQTGVSTANKLKEIAKKVYESQVHNEDR